MKYQVKFADSSIEKKFGKVLSKVPHRNTQDKIIEAIKDLARNPRPYGRKPFKQISPPMHLYQYTAQYRLKIGNYRVLYDVDDEKKIVWILVLRKRSERTYRF